jgi:hypothetical protein
MIRLKNYFLFWKVIDKPVNTRDFIVTELLAGLTALFIFIVIMVPFISLEQQSQIAQQEGTGYYIYLGHLNAIAALFITNFVQQIALVIRYVKNFIKE